ncbi:MULTISPECIES: hypothetical protein [Streptomyces]|uniref:Uncharacterized protein n=1 Tax=Streptomyces doudnae TaxID=3075536 RepID=A0ABD5ENQ8_9ACTN|nr:MULTISPECIES: hypothetical protein [unclassified Streptomyces]MDT0435674.1 hypothetical protein [Streptomyces sp. DSM 41981]MYQ62628.1 hypothetical protein [Streptomyces sp. SID4950]SCD41043.1 hypothetical protein GA0115242_1048134 [Streptomyces sp. SolWspMP-5a-2]
MSTASCAVPPHPVPAAGARITAADAVHVLQHFGHSTPGPDRRATFRGRLTALVAEADHANRMALATGYPGLVAAVQLARTSPTGISTLRTIAHLH